MEGNDTIKNINKMCMDCMRERTMQGDKIIFDIEFVGRVGLRERVNHAR
mgnify:CR=1 FL=1